MFSSIMCIILFLCNGVAKSRTAAMLVVNLFAVWSEKDIPLI